MVPNAARTSGLNANYAEKLSVGDAFSIALVPLQIY
jgi:hypothetical protein